MASTWILVADAARARLFEPAPTDGHLVEIECFTNPEGRVAARRAVVSHPPAIDEDLAAARLAIAPHTTVREKVAARFAHLLGEALERGRSRRRYERLVLVAPPRFLGALHEQLGQGVRDRVAGELRRDLTALHPAELRARLPRRLLARDSAAAAR